MFVIDHRRDSRTPIDMLLNKYVAGIPYLCRATNLSEGGMLVHKLLEPELGTSHVVGLQFELPGHDRIVTAAGRVVYDHPWLRAVGVRFTNLSADHRTLIRQYLLDQARKRPAFAQK